MSTGNGEQYNLRSPAVKRILREAAEMRESTYEYYAQPLEDNIFEWHFTVRGAEETEFTDGLYHGRITLPNDYPMKPPSIILLTPNGRFEVNKKICLSISGYHPETWQPCWSIRTVLMAIISFMPTKSDGAIGSLEYTAGERRQLARRSHRWQCQTCGPILGHLKETKEEKGSVAESREEAVFADFMAKVSFQSEKPPSTSNSTEIESKEVSKNGSTSVSESSESSSNPRTNSTSSDIFPPVETNFSPAVSDSTPEPTTASTDTETNRIQAELTRTPAVTPITATLPSQTNQDSFLHGPLTNGILKAIVILIVAILFRRFLMMAKVI